MRLFMVLVSVAVAAFGCARQAEITPTRIAEIRALPDSIAYTDGPLFRALRAGRPELMDGTPVREREWTDDPRKFSFVVIGDRTGGGRENWHVFDEAIHEINLLRPNFAIMVGDMIWGGHSDTAYALEEWKLFRSHAGKIEMPLFFVPGNHDVTTPELESYWLQNIGRLYYSFEYMGCLFLVLNTEQERFSGRWGFGEEQIAFAVSELQQNAVARHTFVFMHKEAWKVSSIDDWERNTMFSGWEASPIGEDWKRIEEALGNRRYTVFAGHRHNATYEIRNGRRYIVVGPTGGGLRPSGVPKMGAFHHYTRVTVDGDSAYVSFIQPGGDMYPADISTHEFLPTVRRMVRVDAANTERREDGRIVITSTITLDNVLEDTVSFRFSFMGLTGNAAIGWMQTAGPESTAVSVAPRERRVFDATFDTNLNGLNNVPRIVAAADYRGERLFEYSQELSAFPESALRVPNEWLVIGPVKAGASEGMPELDLILSEDGSVVPDARLRSEIGPVDAVSWESIPTRRDGTLELSWFYQTTAHAAAYGALMIVSPEARQVWVALESDDYSRLVINGKMVASGRRFTHRMYQPLDLRSGANILIVKSVNTGSAWSYRLRFFDPQSELRFFSP